MLVMVQMRDINLMAMLNGYRGSDNSCVALFRLESFNLNAAINAIPESEGNGTQIEGKADLRNASVSFVEKRLLANLPHVKIPSVNVASVPLINCEVLVQIKPTLLKVMTCLGTDGMNRMKEL